MQSETCFIPEIEVSDEDVARVLAKLREMGETMETLTFAQVRRACLKLLIHKGIPTIYNKIVGAPFKKCSLCRGDMLYDKMCPGCGESAVRDGDSDRWLMTYMKELHLGEVEFPLVPKSAFTKFFF